MEAPKAQGPVDRSKAQLVNLAVLKRIDPEVQEVIANASHVCLYHMPVNTQAWARKNVEGSLFLLKRRTEPRFQMLVMNKLSTDNYIETIHGGLELEINPPYLMYTHGNDEIHGIWFYEVGDLETVGQFLKRIVNQLPKPDGYKPDAPEDQEPASSAAGPPVSEDAFWDKRVNVTPAALLEHEASRAVEAQPMFPQDEPPPSLADMLRLAHAKHQTAKQPTTGAAPGPLIAALASGSTPSDPASEPKALLTPLFFQQTAADSMPVPEGLRLQEHNPIEARENGGNPLRQLFARAKKPSAMEQPLAPPPLAPVPPAQVPSNQAPAAVARSAQVLQTPAVREKLRKAFLHLLDNDNFVDMVGTELQRVGLLPPVV